MLATVRGSFSQCAVHVIAKYRTPSVLFVLVKPVQQLTLRFRSNCVSAYSDHTESSIWIRAGFGFLEEKVNTAPRPTHIPVTVGQPPLSANALLKTCQEIVKTLGVALSIGHSQITPRSSSTQTPDPAPVGNSSAQTLRNHPRSLELPPSLHRLRDGSKPPISRRADRSVEHRKSAQ